FASARCSKGVGLNDNQRTPVSFTILLRRVKEGPFRHAHAVFGKQAHLFRLWDNLAAKYVPAGRPKHSDDTGTECECRSIGEFVAQNVVRYDMDPDLIRVKLNILANLLIIRWVDEFRAKYHDEIQLFRLRQHNAGIPSNCDSP